MKKLPLAIAMVSLLAASSSFAEMYQQNFEVSLNIPSSVDVQALQHEVVNLSVEDLSSAMNSDGVLIGSMNIQTSAGHCAAEITTDHDFKLVNNNMGSELPYTLEYIATDISGNSITTPFSTNASSGYGMEKTVGCNIGDLKMRLSRMDMDQGMYMDQGTYNDVIHVMVRAES